MQEKSNITHLELAEELSSARNSIDKTLLILRSQINSLAARLQSVSQELEASGVGADLQVLGSVQEQGLSIDNLASKLGRQKIHLEQAFSYVKLVQKS
jgi:hypothetical protein